MKSGRKKRLQRGLLTVLTLGLVLGPASAGGASLTARAAEEFYSHTFTEAAKQGDNVCGDLTWNFSMAATGDVEGSRGMRFLVADSATQELVIKTTVGDVEISQIQVEAAMSANSDTTFSISIGGEDIVQDQAVTNTNNRYTYNTDGASGEIVMRMKATVAGKTSYLKSITLLTGEVEEPGMRANYHNHTYRCNHAGTAQDKAYVEAAIRNGYSIMGFTDHVMLPWINYPNGVRGEYRIADEYISSIRSLQKEYEGEIYLLLGYECEWNEVFEEYYRHLVDNNLVDYLILGNHYLEFSTVTNTFTTFSGSLDSEAYVKAYADSSIAALESGLFSVFAHPDYFMSTVTFWNDNVEAQVRRMCETAKEMGVAMEINEGCFNNESKRQMGDEYRYRYPYDKFWKIVKEVGNTVVLGVDAHDPSAYNESARKMAMDFAGELGITVTEDLGITVKTPNPDAPVYSAPGVTEPPTGTGTTPTTVAAPSSVYADLLDFDRDSVEFREVNGSTATLEVADGHIVVGNTNGAWPNVVIGYGDGIKVNVNDTLVYDLETRNGMETSLRLNFLDKDGTKRQAVLNQGMPADTAPDSGDLRTNQSVKGAMTLAALAEGDMARGGFYPGRLLGEYADADGYITVTSVEVYAAGPATGSVVLNQLEIGAPDEEEKPSHSIAESGDPTGDITASETDGTAYTSAADESAASTEPHGITAGTNGQPPATGEGSPAGGAAFLLLSSAVLLAAGKGKGIFRQK